MTTKCSMEAVHIQTSTASQMEHQTLPKIHKLWKETCEVFEETEEIQDLPENLVHGGERQHDDAQHEIGPSQWNDEKVGGSSELVGNAYSG